jgi:Ca2+-binding EF-hand superfamily protein
MSVVETHEEILRKLSLVIARNGIATMIRIKKALASFDEGTGVIFNEEFVSALMKGYIFLSKHDASALLRRYRADDLRVQYALFLEDMQSEMTSIRLAIVTELFAALLTVGAESIAYQTLIDKFDASAHPNVVMGMLSIEKARQMLVEALDSTADSEGYITKSKFVDAFRGISAAYPYNAERFTDFVSNCWHSVLLTKEANIEETQDAMELKEYFSQLTVTFAEKVEQKAAGSTGKRTTLIRAFKHFDIGSEGNVQFKEFQRTLETFGVIVPVETLKAYFNSFASCDGKKINYKTLAAEIFTE